MASKRTKQVATNDLLRGLISTGEALIYPENTAALHFIQARMIARRCRIGQDHARLVASLLFGEVAQ